MKVFIPIVILCFSVSINAQYTEVANINFQKFYGETENGDAYQTNKFEAALLYGFNLKKKSDKNTLFFRANYQQRILQGASETRLYKPELIAGLSHTINEFWNYRLFGVARLASDFEDITSEHYQFGAGTIITYTKNENLKFKFGGYARDQPDGVLAFPFLGLDYKFGNDRWFLNVLLPQYAFLRYELSENWYSGIRLNYVTEQYKLSEQSSPSDYIELSEFQAELFIEYYLTKTLVAFSRFGIYNYQKYEVFDADDMLLNDGLDEVKNNLSLRFGIAFRLQN